MHIAGTSAGASILGNRFIVESDGEADQVDSLKLSDGFNFANRLVIDQHFSQRGRFGRLIYEVGLSNGIIGLGVDENTAAILNGNELFIIGNNMVTIMDGRNLDFVVKKNGDGEMAISGITLHFIPEKYCYSLETGSAFKKSYMAVNSKKERTKAIP